MDRELSKEIDDLKSLCNKYEEEHKTTYETWKKDIEANKRYCEVINELTSRISKAIEYIKADYINGTVDGLSWLETQKLLKILRGEE